jgi:anti-sigma-K factor RskA
MHRSLSAPVRIACLLAVGVVSPTAATADDAARISRLETEIQQLRAQVDEQGRRIQQLESELARRAGPLSVPAQPKPRAGEMRTDAPAATGPQAWHSAPAWARVRPGLTEAEVVAILGPPTAADSVGALKSLFYRGAAPGGRALSGHVNLKDGLVVAVSQPAF